jgi:hypothetical protein
MAHAKSISDTVGADSLETELIDARVHWIIILNHYGNMVCGNAFGGSSDNLHNVLVLHGGDL